MNLPGHHFVHRGWSQAWQPTSRGGKHGERSPGTTWFKPGFQGLLGHWSYFTASLRNGTNELALNVTWLLRLKKNVNFTHLWHVGPFLPVIPTKSPSFIQKNVACKNNKRCIFLETTWWSPESQEALFYSLCCCFPWQHLPADDSSDYWRLCCSSRFSFHSSVLFFQDTSQMVKSKTFIESLIPQKCRG